MLAAPRQDPPANCRGGQQPSSFQPRCCADRSPRTATVGRQGCPFFRRANSPSTGLVVRRLDTSQTRELFEESVSWNEVPRAAVVGGAVLESAVVAFKPCLRQETRRKKTIEHDVAIAVPRSLARSSGRSGPASIRCILQLEHVEERGLRLCRRAAAAHGGWAGATVLRRTVVESEEAAPTVVPPDSLAAHLDEAPRPSRGCARSLVTAAPETAPLASAPCPRCASHAARIWGP